MTADEHVPSDDQVRGRYCDGTYLQTGRTTDGGDFDAWLARVKRDAWEEGYDAAADFYDVDVCLAADNPYEETPND